MRPSAKAKGDEATRIGRVGRQETPLHGTAERGMENGVVLMDRGTRQPVSLQAPIELVELAGCQPVDADFP